MMDPVLLMLTLNQSVLVMVNGQDVIVQVSMEAPPLSSFFFKCCDICLPTYYYYFCNLKCCHMLESNRLGLQKWTIAGKILLLPSFV
jgi:hypothetical protein